MYGWMCIVMCMYERICMDGCMCSLYVCTYVRMHAANATERIGLCMHSIMYCSVSTSSEDPFPSPPLVVYCVECA